MLFKDAPHLGCSAISGFAAAVYESFVLTNFPVSIIKGCLWKMGTFDPHITKTLQQ